MPRQKARRAYTASFKLSVCKVAEKKGNRAAGREFGVDESIIRRWMKQRKTLEEIPAQKKARRSGLAKWPELEEQLIVWIAEERLQGNGTSISALRSKARELADSAGIQDFAATYSWASRFLGRHGISAHQLISDPVPEDLEENLTTVRLVFKEEIKEEDEDFEGF